MVHCMYLGVTGYTFQIKIAFLSLKIDFALANSVDPDEMPHYVAFHLSLHYLPKYTFRSHWYMKGYKFQPIVREVNNGLM